MRPLALLPLALSSQALAWQCQPLSVLLERAPTVFIAQVLQRLPEAPPPTAFPPPAGLPGAGRVRLAVREVLRGSPPERVDLPCAADDPRCRPGGPLLLVALPGTAGHWPAFCGMDYLEPADGEHHGDIPARQQAIGRLRAAGAGHQVAAPAVGAQ